MNENIFFGISLTGSFLAGMLALFAPCCITFLLPSYFGTIFKRTEKVLLYTLIFALGLSTIFVPVALGFKLIVSFFDSFHGGVYYFGAIVLVLMGIMTLLEVKMPFNFAYSQKNNKVDIFSTYTLGIVSGITSSCCAPVLFAAITLTSMAPNFPQAIIVSLAYIFGIVFPLFLISFFYNKISSKVLMKARKNVYIVFKYLGSAIFVLSGLAIGVMNYYGKIVMKDNLEESQAIRMVIFEISKYFQNPIIDIVTFVSIVSLFYFLVTRKNTYETDPICHMKVDPKTTKFTKKINGKNYFFCSQSCMDSAE